MKNRIASVVSLSLLFSIILVSCSKSSGTSNNTPPEPNTVSIINMTFTPATITVTAGTKVTWKNNDNMTHTVTANDDSYDSGNIGPGSSFSKTFSIAGTYPYHCSIHPSMTGKVVVN
jgi:plastocyanin